MKKVSAIAVNIIVIGLVALVMIWVNTFCRQWTHYQKGEKAFAAGDAIGAVAGYESAIHMYTPASPLVGKAAEKLWIVGQTFEGRGDPERALIAYRSLRSSFYSIRGLFQPGREWIQRCDAKIPPLSKILQERQRQ